MQNNNRHPARSRGYNRQRTSERAGYTTKGVAVFKATSSIRCTVCHGLITEGRFFTATRSYGAVCGNCEPFEIDGNSRARVLPHKVDRQGQRDRYPEALKEAASACDCGNPKNIHYNYCRTCASELEARRHIRVEEQAIVNANKARIFLRQMQTKGLLREQRMPEQEQPVPLNEYAPVDPPPQPEQTRRRRW